MRYLYVSDVTGSPVVNTVSVATPGCDYSYPHPLLGTIQQRNN